MEKVKLTTETFDSVMQMLKSSDKENVVLGLTCIEELDITTGLVYLLLIKKLANVTSELWKEYCPKKVAYMNSMTNTFNTVLTYKKILELLVERKVPTTDIQFFMDKFALYLMEGLRNDYALIESIEINLKLKLHDTEPSRELIKSIQDIDAT